MIDEESLKVLDDLIDRRERLLQRYENMGKDDHPRYHFLLGLVGGLFEAKKILMRADGRADESASL